jgi:hypothetical protein
VGLLTFLSFAPNSQFDPHHRCGTIFLLITAPRPGRGVSVLYRRHLAGISFLLVAQACLPQAGFSLCSFQFSNPKTQL